jgi:Kazal-type serine protease inhibitor domain
MGCMSPTTRLRSPAYALWLLLATACGDVAEHDLGSPGDAAVDDAGSPGEDAAASCSPRDCQGQGIPDLACASGPTEVRCVPGAAGGCRFQVSCAPTGGEPPDGGSAAPDAASSVDAGPSVGGGTSCGGFAGLRCPGGNFCDYSEAAGGNGCGVADGLGVCTPQPQGCPAIYQPVCGCDLHSYPSSCDAHAAGMGLSHDGLCTADECARIGGAPAYSDGANPPSCPRGKQSYPIPGREPGLCCY